MSSKIFYAALNIRIKTSYLLNSVALFNVKMKGQKMVSEAFCFFLSEEKALFSLEHTKHRTAFITMRPGPVANIENL